MNMRFRNSAKAIIIKDDHILAIEKHDNEGPWYFLPGGGQEHGETLEEAVVRECLEETGSTVRPLNISFIREYIGKNHEFAAHDGDLHQVEIYFKCELVSDTDKNKATNPDSGQTDFKWIPLDSTDKYRFYPKFLIEALNNGSFQYYGDRN